jgi:prepilin-type processing-associated H-X9-DG protein
MSAQNRRTPGWLIVLLVVGGLCLSGICVISLSILLPTFVSARERARLATCSSNLRQLVQAQQLYAQDNGDRFPAAARWGDALRPYASSPELFRCPSVDRSQGFGYAMNVRLSRKEVKALPNPAQVPLLYDSSNLAWNAHDPVTSLPNPPRHGGNKVNNIAFADGTARAVR